MWKKEERKEKMKEGEGMMMDMKSPGRLAVSGKKTFLGVPRNKISSKSNMSCLDKANSRGKDEAKIKKG